MNKKKRWSKIRNEGCTLCPLAESAQYVCLIGRGDLEADIMIVGEAPGVREDDIGKPFQGRSGKLLDDLLAELGISRSSLYITNSCRCRPPDNRTPTNKEIKACKKYLIEEVELVKPSLIIALGKPALYALTGKSGITEHRGTVIQGVTIGSHTCDVIPTFHPAFALRNPGSLEPLARDLELAIDYFHGRIEVKKAKVELIESLDQLDLAIKDIRSVGEVAFDFETVGTDYWNPMMTTVMLGLSCRDGHAWTIPLYHQESLFSKSDIDTMMRRLRDLVFNNPVVEKVAHNFKFDYNIARCKHGIEFGGPMFDTMLAHYLLDENSLHGLDKLTLRYLEYGTYWDEVTDDVSNGRANTVPLDKLSFYCGTDAAATIELKHLFELELGNDKRLRRVFDLLLMPGSLNLADVELNGMLIDMKYAARIQEEFEFRVEKQLEELGSDPVVLRWMKRSNRTKVNFNSPQQMADLLFSVDGFGFESVTKTKTGQPATDEQTIDNLLRDNRDNMFMRRLVRYRKTAKFLSTYLIGIPKLADRGGRVHPHFKLHGTVTGRLSCKDPNLQNIPRDTTSKEVKNMFVARPGYTLVQADASQAELRIMAMMANEETMMKWFATGKDVHLYVAAKVSKKKPELGDGSDQVHKAERKNAKTINFGMVYMVGDYTLSESLSNPETCPKCSTTNPDVGKNGLTKCCGVKPEPEIYYSPEQAGEFKEEYFEMFPRVLKFIERQRRAAMKYKRVRSMFGRIRRVPGIDSDARGVVEEAVRFAVNSPIQSAASDYVLFGSSYMAGKIDGSIRIPHGVLPINTVHDSIIYECPDELVPTFAKLLKNTLDNLPTEQYFGFKFSVPMVVDIETGKRWGEMKSFKLA